MAAAAAWDALAAELSSAAASYGTEVSVLTGGAWLGPASASMAAAAAPYTAWMSTTAEQAKQAADQARAAAAAYEAAFAAHVPPPIIAENRALLMSLVATNVLGQNTPAIAATEAHYAEMWAQDATAMYGYAAGSAAASTLTPFTEPPQNTNPAGVSAQAVAVGQALGTSAAHTPSALSQLVAAVPNVLQGLASGGSGGPTTGLGGLLNSSLGSALGTDFLNFTSGWTFVASGLLFILGPLLADPIIAASADSPALVSWHDAGQGAARVLGGRAPGAPGRGSAEISAALGRAAPIGGLSVPPTWAVAAPMVTAPPGPTLVGLPAAEVDGLGYGGMLPGSLMAAAAGGGGAAAGVRAAQRGSGAPQSGGGTRTRYGPCPTVIPEVAREAGLPGGARGQTTWPDERTESGEGPSSAKIRDEINDLRAQVAELAMERDVLMRSLALWSREPKGR